jgi:MFS transporter, ACS family, D-galactonate transporter
MTVPVPARPLSTIGRWRVVVLLMLLAALGHFNRVGISVAGSEVFIPKVGLTEVQMGWVYTTFLVVYAVGMLPGGWLIDLIGATRALALYGVCMGLFVALTGALGWLTTGPAQLLLGLLIIRGLAGFCNAPLHPGAAHVVSDIMAPWARAGANGLITAGAVIGIAFSYPLFGGLMDRLGWPLAFVVSGAVLSAYGVYWRWATKGLDLVAAQPLAMPMPGAARGRAGATLRLLGSRPLWLLSISYAAYGYFQYLFFYWMDYYFKSVLNVPDMEARWSSFWIMLAMGAGMAVGGLSTDLITRMLGAMRGRRAIVFVGMGMGALFGLLGVNATDYRQVAIYLAISMAALGMCEGVFWTTATDLGGESRGFSGAFMNALGNVGGLISPVLTPYMAQKIGWPGSIAVACGVVALGGAVWFAIRIPDAPHGSPSSVPLA